MSIKNISLGLLFACSVNIAVKATQPHNDPRNVSHTEGSAYGRDILRYHITTDKNGNECYEVLYKSKANDEIYSEIVPTKPDGAYKNEGKRAFVVRIIKDHHGCFAGAIGAVIASVVGSTVVTITSNIHSHQFSIGLVNLFCLTPACIGLTVGTVERAYKDIRKGCGIVPDHQAEEHSQDS